MIDIENRLCVEENELLVPERRYVILEPVSLYPQCSGLIYIASLALAYPSPWVFMTA